MGLALEWIVLFYLPKNTCLYYELFILKSLTGLLNLIIIDIPNIYSIYLWNMNFKSIFSIFIKSITRINLWKYIDGITRYLSLICNFSKEKNMPYHQMWYRKLNAAIDLMKCLMYKVDIFIKTRKELKIMWKIIIETIVNSCCHADECHPSIKDLICLFWKMNTTPRMGCNFQVKSNGPKAQYFNCKYMYALTNLEL